MTDDRDDLVVLVDEDGNEEEFEYLDTIELNDNEYVVLVPYEGEESEEAQDEDEVIILKIQHDENGEDSYITVDDEDELEEVFEEFKNRMEEDYDPNDEE